MIESVGCEYIQVIISQDGKRIWVYSPEGTLFKAKVTDYIILQDDRER